MFLKRKERQTKEDIIFMLVKITDEDTVLKATKEEKDT